LVGAGRRPEGEKNDGEHRADAGGGPAINIIVGTTLVLGGTTGKWIVNFAHNLVAINTTWRRRQLHFSFYSGAAIKKNETHIFSTGRWKNRPGLGFAQKGSLQFAAYLLLNPRARSQFAAPDSGV
jgi:hypothetical protein